MMSIINLVILCTIGVGTVFKPGLLLFLFPVFALFLNPDAFVFGLAPDDYALMGLVLSFVLHFLFRGQMRYLVPHKALLCAIIVFLCWTLFVGFYHALFGTIVTLGNTVKSTGNVALRMLFPFVVAYFITSMQDIRRYANVVMVCIVIILVIHTFIVIYFGNPAAIRMQSDIIAAPGTLLYPTLFCNPNHFSRYLYFSYPLLFICITDYNDRRKYLAIFLLVFSAFSIIMTASRMGALMVVILLAAAAVFYQKKKWLIVGLGIAAGILIVFTIFTEPLIERFSRIENLEEQNRVIIAIESLRLISEHPIVGTGPGTFNQLMLQTGLFNTGPRGKAAHNNYIFLAVQYGITACLLFTFIFYLYVVYFWKGMKLSTYNRHYFFAGIALIIAFQGGGMTATIMGSNYFFYLLGLFYTLFYLHDRREGTPRQASSQLLTAAQ